MTIQQLLTELFDRPLEHSPLIRDGKKMVSWFYVEDMVYVFMATSFEGLWDVEFFMVLTEFNKEEQQYLQKQDPLDPYVWPLLKKQVGRHGTQSMTHTGHSVAVVSTIVNLFDQFMQSTLPKEVKFTAKTSDSGRVKLYRRLAKLAGTKYNYSVEEQQRESAVVWYLTQQSE